MGNPHSRPEDRLGYISREVNALRSSLRHSRQNLSKDKKEAIIESLAHQSSEVDFMRDKVKPSKVDKVMKDISLTMEEVLKIEPRDSDMGRVESYSFDPMPISKSRENSVGSLTSQRTTATRKSQIRNFPRSSAPTIREIETKFEKLKPLITTALDNMDKRQLRVHYKTIHILATELEMIHVEKDTPLESRKVGLMNKLTSWYQKLTKVLRNYNKEDNLQNISTQKRKEEAFNELGEIELHVAENESLIDRMNKEKNTGEFGNIRNNLVKLSQRLNKVDIVDNDVKEKIVILTQKISELVKNLDYSMTKKEFESKFLQLFDSYQRTVKNFTGPSNAETTVKTLENICASVENLEELNDSTKNKKTQLLSAINGQIKNIKADLTKESDSETVQQIVEDNVVLRKKVKSTDREHTVIDQFFCHWDNVRSNFDINAYSNLSLLRIDSVLEEMQHSINDIRIGISNKCDTNPPTNLVRKRSQSVPRLNTKKNYGSRQSLDQLDNQLIKAKAKVYNLSTSEKLNVKKQQENYTNNRFSEINQIKMQVHYIKEKIDENHNNNLLRQKLEEYHQGLTEYCNDSNKTVANNAIILSNDITELLLNLEVADYKERVKLLKKRVQNFNGTRCDKQYDEIKDDLLKCQVSLENFQIPNEFNLLQIDKNNLLDEILNNISSLQGKATYLKKNESETVKNIKANLQMLNDKVKRFSGTYKGVLYNQIERDLNKILVNIGEQTESKMCAEELRKEVEHLLKILESRSSLAQSFKNLKYDTNKSEELLGITKIKNDLNNIKTEIDKTPDENVNAFIGLQSRLDLVNLEFSQISSKPNEQLEKERDIFSNEIQTLKNVVDAKVALGQQPLVQWPEREMQADLQDYPKNDVNKEMEKLESKFQKIKNEVSGPNIEEDIYKCYKLAQDIKKLLEKLDQYKFVRASDLFIRKTNLQNEMQHYLQVLEKETKDTDYVIDIEKRVNSIENLLSSNRQSDIKAMAKELQAIQNNLVQHKISAANDTLRERKTSIQQKTDSLVQKLIKMSDSEAENKNKQLKEEIKKIIDIEEQLKVLRPEILRFVGLQSDNKFYELDETTMRYILILDKIDSDNPELHRRKIKLLKELHQLGEILDDRAKQTKEVKDLEDKMDELTTTINNFSGKEEEILQIKDKRKETVNMLQSLQVVKELVPRKNACVEAMSVLFNRVMTLEVSKPPSHAFNLEINSDSIPIKSSEFSSTTSSTKTIVTQNRSLGYNTQVYNFTDSGSNTATSRTTTSNSATSSNTAKSLVKLNDSNLLQIEKDIKRLELILNSTNDEQKLDKIDNAFIEYTKQLANMNYPRDCAEFKIKTKLFQKIEILTDTIEQIIQDNQLVTKIKQEVDEIANTMNFPLSDDQINTLDERLIQLLTTLGHINTPSLKNEKEACMMQIMLYSKNISDYKNAVKNTAV